MSSVLSERDRAIGAYCAIGEAHLCTAPKRTSHPTSSSDLTSPSVKPFLLRVSVALLTVIISGGALAAAVDVVGNDTTDSYEISGAVIVDGGFSEAHAAATCGNCHWHIVRICPPQALDERLGCTVFPCAVERSVVEIWRADADLRPPADDPLWQYHGLACIEAAPIAASALTAGARDMAIRALPPLKPVSQPASTTLTGLNTNFQSQQPSQLVTAAAIVAGESIRIRAVPTWIWDFGHGGVLTTSDPGGPWSNGRIRHTYPKRGIFRVRVTNTWRATYEVRGIPDLPVDGVITQSAWFDLRVREARRFLQQPKGA